VQKGEPSASNNGQAATSVVSSIFLGWYFLTAMSSGMFAAVEKNTQTVKIIVIF
jgi:hypothetical protein